MLAGRLTRCQILLPFVTHFKKSGQARFEARKGNTGQISRQPTPNLTQDLCAAVNQRQKVSLEQYAKTGGLRPPCKFLGRSLPRKENGYFLAIFEQKPTQDAWHILTTLEILSWYIRTGVNKITPYQQMKCFTNKSVTSWFFGNEETAAIFFGLMIVFFSFFWLIFSMISLFVFKFLFQYLITYYLIIGVLCWFYFIFLVSNCVLYYPLFHFEFSLCFVFCLTGYLIFMLFLFVLFLFLCSNYSIFDRFWTINNEK